MNGLFAPRTLAGTDRASAALRRALAGAACLLSGGLAGCGGDEAGEQGSRDRRPNVILFTLDTTRADRLGCYGYEAGETPVLDACAEQGYLFERAYCTAPITLPSHVSILTGTYPCAHQVRDNALFSLGEDAVSVAEVMQDEGYQTGAFVGSYVVDSKFGTGQGFDHFQHATEPGPGGVPLTEVKAGLSVDRLVEWLGTLDRDRPAFVWLHFYDPHLMWTPPEEFRARFADPYDAEIAYCDHEYGRALAAIRGHFGERETLQFITADHGEGLGEHGERTHGHFLYDEVMRVPMIVVPPESARPQEPARFDAPVTNASIPATLLGMLGISADRMPSAQLPPLLDADGAAVPMDAPIYFEGYLTFYSFRWAPLEGFLDGDLKFIRTKRNELYDLSADPDEERDLLPDDEARDARLFEQLQKLKEQHSPLGWEATQVTDAAEIARLQALGYTVGAGTALPDFDRPDPKDMISTVPIVDKARNFVEGGKYALQRDAAEAAKLFARCEELLVEIEEVDPDGIGPLEIRGRMYYYQGKKRRALPYFERAVEHASRSPQLHFLLAECYRAMGHRDWALQEYRKTVRLEPRFRDAYTRIGEVLAKQQRFGEAAWLAARLVEAFEEIGIESEANRRLLEGAEKAMRQHGQSPTPLPDDLSWTPERLLHEERDAPEADGDTPR